MLRDNVVAKEEGALGCAAVFAVHTRSVWLLQDASKDARVIPTGILATVPRVDDGNAAAPCQCGRLGPQPETERR